MYVCIYIYIYIYMKVPRAPKWFDYEFPLINPTKLLVETRSS